MLSAPPLKRRVTQHSTAPCPAVSVVGGDEREREVILALAREGHRVFAAGRRLGEDEAALGAREVETAEALSCPFVITPMAGIDGYGKVYARPPHAGAEIDDSLLATLSPGAVWFVGVVREPFLTKLRSSRAVLVDLLDVEELTVLNSIPSAEGALQIAMECSPFCLHGSRVLVLGFGRTGQTLSWMLRGIGSQVCVVARRAGPRARALAMGYGAAGFEDLGELLRQALFCFNTVPAMVLTAEVLALADRDLTIVDLASRPGGTDFAAAEARGIRARLAPGLPGLVAPRTAGRFLAQVILGLLKESANGA